MAAIAVRMLAWRALHGDGGNGGEDAGLARIEHAERAAERNEHKRELAGAGEYRSGAQRIAATNAGRAEQ